MSNPQAQASNAVLLRIVHEESNSTFAIRCSNTELLTERNGLKRLLRIFVPKLNESANISANISAAVLSYCDEDGDQITVRTDSDLKEAIRLASLRQICIKVTFDQSVQPAANLDASTGSVGASWSDSSSDVQIECENAALAAAPERPPAAAEGRSHAVSTDQTVAVDPSLESLVRDSPRILLIEQSLKQQMSQIWEAIEDINRAHAQDRIYLNQTNRSHLTAVEEVRHSLLESSTRLGLLEEAHQELKSTAASLQNAVAACVSDVTSCNLAQLQHDVHQLQLAAHSLQQNQQQLISDSTLNELKDQYQQLKRELDCINQQQLRISQIEFQQKQISDRICATEQLQLQLREHQHELHQKLLTDLQLQREHDRVDVQRLLDERFEGLHQRMSQLESHRDSWTTIERLVMSGSTGSGSGIQASRYNVSSDEAHAHQQDCPIGDSYVALQPSDVNASAASELHSRPLLRVAAVHVQFNQQDALPVQLLARGESSCSTDADFSVSISANVNQFFFDLQVTVENVSSCVVPEDVELRLVSQSRGVSKATQTMHKIPRTKKPMQPKETFTFIVCCTAPAVAGAVPSRVEWQPYSAGAAIGSSLAVFVNGKS